MGLFGLLLLPVPIMHNAPPPMQNCATATATAKKRRLHLHFTRLYQIPGHTHGRYLQSGWFQGPRAGPK
jgi:hypothetical protein